MVDMDDVQAIAAALTGDEAGFRVLFTRYHDTLFRYVNSLHVVDRGEALDIVQETFIRVFRSLGQMRDRERFFPILRTTARNRAFTRLRGAKHRQQILDAFWERVRLVPPSGAGAVAHAHRVAQEVLGAYPDGELKETAQRYYLGDEVTTDELAKQLGLPKGTITARLKRFRDDVKARLAAGLVDIDDDED